MIEFEQALKNPAAAFEAPEAILRASGLSADQKVKLLRQWEYDALQLEVATEENMPSASGGGSRLAEVVKALEALGEKAATGPGGTKFG